MVFGVFDGLHPGHEHFLTEAAKRCHSLTVVVTPKSVVQKLKKRTPKNSFDDRVAKIGEFAAAHDPVIELEVVSGDESTGDWQILKTYKPEVVFLGYDQQQIAGELDRMNMAYEFIGSFEPEKYKSSLL
jgi:FAD synthetase